MVWICLNSEIFRQQLGWDVCVTVLKRSLIPTIHKHNLPGCATMPWTLPRRSYRAHPANQFYVVGLWDFAWCFLDSVWDFNIHKTFLVFQGLGRQWVQLHFTDARLKLSRRESGLAPRQWGDGETSHRDGDYRWWTLMGNSWNYIRMD